MSLLIAMDKAKANEVLERLSRQVESDHKHCTFHASMSEAPDQKQCIAISQSTKYRFIRASTSVTMMEGNTAVERWYNPAQRVIFDKRSDNGNRLNRYWTEYSYPRQRAEKSENNNVVLPPRLSLPGVYDSMAQIDIKSAYYSIMNIVGLHPAVVWGKSFGVGDKLEPYYPFTEYKVVRNSLYGTSFNPRLTYVTRGEWKTTYPKNKVSNPHLIQVVQTILHSIARKAFSMGAIQWNTDGGILPYSRVWEFMLWVGETYGLTCKLICVGPVLIVRPDQYITDSHKIRRRIGIPEKVNTIDGFRDDYPYGDYENWLTEKLKPWVLRRSEPYIIDQRNDEKWQILR